MHVLHVGCGGESLPEWFRATEVTRLDIDSTHAPDIVADMADMGDIGEFDALYSSHSLEHLPPHGVDEALREFVRVLKPGGYATIVVPDLEGVEATDEVLLQTPAGPIAGLDLIYGFRPMLKEKPYMAHRSGFVRQTLEKAMLDAGFARVLVRRVGDYNLLGAGVK